MSDKEKEILNVVKRAVPKMSEFDKGYLLGFSESKVSDKKNQRKEEGEENETD